MGGVLGALRLDLIQKRLLPIPLVLGALLIAIPVVASHRHDTAVPSVDEATATPAAGVTVGRPAAPGATAAPGQTATPAQHVTATPKSDAKATKTKAAATTHAERNPFPAAGSSSAAGTSKTATPAPAATKTVTKTSAATTAPAAKSAPFVTGKAPSVPAETDSAAATEVAPTVTVTVPATTPKVKPTETAVLPGGGTAVSSRGAVHNISEIDLRFGAAVVPGIRKDVARMTALPNVDRPVAILLGSRADRSSAVFAIASGVTVEGQGTCVPRRRLCTQLVLKKGQRALLTRADGKRLRLELVRVRVVKTHSLKQAMAAAARESAAGRCIYDQIQAYDYSPVTGTLRRAANPKDCRYPALAAAQTESSSTGAQTESAAETAKAAG